MRPFRDHTGNCILKMPMSVNNIKWNKIKRDLFPGILKCCVLIEDLIIGMSTFQRCPLLRVDFLCTTADRDVHPSPCVNTVALYDILNTNAVLLPPKGTYCMIVSFYLQNRRGEKGSVWRKPSGEQQGGIRLSGSGRTLTKTKPTSFPESLPPQPIMGFILIWLMIWILQVQPDYDIVGPSGALRIKSRLSYPQINKHGSQMSSSSKQTSLVVPVALRWQ